MNRIVLGLSCIIVSLSLGCDSDQNPIASSNASSVEERAVALADQIRTAMTEPEIMKLPVGPTANTGERFRRQVAAAASLILELVACGEAAEEPLWKLLNDSDESVRRSTVVLLNNAIPIEDGQGNQIVSSAIGQNLADLSIPLMERALGSDDAQIRVFACANLGDYSRHECLERSKVSVVKLREMRNDDDEDVRGIAWTSCRFILGELSRRASTAEDRDKALQEWEQLGQEETEWHGK